MEQRSERSGRRGGFFLRLGMGWGGLAGFLACLLAGTCAAANVGEVKWEFKPAGGTLGSPAIGEDGTVYVASGNKLVYALDGATGAKQWDFDTGSYGMASPVIGADGTVYVMPSFPGMICALDGATGTPKWEFSASGGIYASPAIGMDGTVFAGTSASNVFALDGSTGTKKWDFRAEAGFSQSPVVGGDETVYISSGDGKVLALDGRSGTRKWTFETEGYVTTAAALGADGTVYVGCSDNWLYALDGGTGAKRWRFTTGNRAYRRDGIASSPVIGIDGTIYFGANDGKAYALDGTIGFRLWEFVTGYGVVASPALTSDGILYVGSQDHQFYALDAATGTKRWSLDLGDWITSSPTIGGDGTVYVGVSGGSLYAIQGSAGLARSPWPQCQNDPSHRGSSQRSGPPVILNQSSPGIAAAGKPLLVGVVASGTAPLNYQWYFNDIPLAQGTGSLYTIPAFSAAHAGTYAVVVSNSLGGITSAPVSKQFGYAIDVQSYGPGGVTKSPDQEAYVPGTDVLLLAKPAAERRFVDWEGNAEGTNVRTTLTVDRNLEVTARFEALPGDPIWERVIGQHPVGDFAMDGNGTLYFGDYPRHHIYAVDSVTGTTRWEFAAEDLLLGPIALGPDGTVYAGSWDHHVYALSATTGSPKWVFEAGESVSPTPAIGADGTLYLGSFDGNLYALAGIDGAIKWAFPAGGAVGIPVIGADGTVFAGVVTNTLCAVDGATGARKWSFAAAGAFGFPAVGRDGTVYAGAEDGKLYALEGNTGAQKWAFPAFTGYVPRYASITSPAIDTGGTVYFGASNGKVFALDGVSGAKKWEFASEGGGVSAPVIGADGTVYVGASDFYVYALDGVRGTKKWSYRTADSVLGSPTLSDDGILYISAGRRIYAIRASSGLAASPWPKFRHDNANTGSAQRLGAPRFLSQTTGGTYTAGTPVNLAVSADGTSPLRYQWYRNGEPLAGATGAVYAVSSLGPANAGVYYVVVANALGRIQSDDMAVNLRYTLDLATVGPGKATKAPDQPWYEPGAVVRLTAIPDPGRRFVGWQGDLNDTNAEIQLTMDRNLRVLARFEALRGEKVWEFKTAGQIQSSPALGLDGLLFIGSNDKRLYALDQSTGAKRWEFATEGFVLSSPAVGANGMVYVGSLDGRVYALDGITGSNKWASQIGGPVASSPAIGQDGTVYVGSSGAGAFRALDGLSGAKKWAFTSAPFNCASPVIGENGTVYVGISDHVFHAFDGGTGLEIWQRPFNEGLDFWNFTQSPAISAKGAVILSGAGGGLCALASETGKLIWESKPLSGENSAGAPVIDAEGRVILCRGQRVLAFDPLTRTQVWSVSVPYADSSTPAIGIDATVYIGSRDGHLYALDGHTGGVQWKFATKGPIYSSPTIGSDGTVYFGSTDNIVYAIRGNGFGGLADSAWPKFHRSVDNRGTLQREGRPEVVTLSGGGLVAAGGSPVLSVSASGSPPFQYQWFFDNRPLTNGTQAKYQVPWFTAAQVGEYYVVVSNAAGQVQSDKIRLDLGYRCVISASAHGRVTRDPDQELYALGTTLRLDAVPNERCRFGSWAGDVESTNLALSVTLDRDLRLECRFEPMVGAKMWEFSAQGSVLGATAAGPDGTVFVGTSYGYVYGLDGDTGVPRWTTCFTNEICGVPAVGRDGTVYLGTSIGQLRALDGRSGAVRWESPIAGNNRCAPAIGSEGIIYVGSTNGRLSAVNGTNGAILWEFTTSGPISSSPSIGRDNTIYVACDSGSVYALAGLTGHSRWVHSELFPSWWSSPAIGPDGTVYVANYRRLLAVDGASGTKRWEFSPSGVAPCYAAVVDSEGTVYFQWDESRWGGFGAHNGWQQSSYPIVRGLGSLPVLGAAGAIYFSTTNGRLVALDRGTGATNWVSAKGEWADRSSLLMGTNGFIYVIPFYTSGIYAFKGDAMLERNAWPKEHHDNRNSGAMTGAPGNHPPVLADIADQTLQAGDTFSLKLAASDPDLPPQALSFSLPPYPLPGMTLDALTGVLTWTPPENQWTSTNVIAVRVTDGEGGSATNQFTLYVKDPRRKWTAAVWGGGFTSCPALGQDGMVYAGTHTGQIFAFDGNSGEQKWVRFGVVGNAPVVGPDGTVYCAFGDTNLCALDAATGATRWQFPTDGLATAPALGADGTLFVGTANGSVYALAGGALKWKIHARGAILAPPAMAADGTVYVGTSERTLLALTGADGQAQWESALGGAMRSPPAIGLDGLVYVGSDAGKILALAAATGAQQWEYVTEGAVEGSPIVGPDGTVYAGSLGGRVYALDGASGRKRWEVSTAAGVDSTPALAADGTLYVGCTDNRLYAWDVATARRQWTHLVGYMLRASPAIGTDGTVYIGSGDTVLLALNPDTKAGLARGGWPKFQGNARNTGNVLDSTANHPPALTTPANQVVDELTRLRLTVSAEDADAPAHTLTYAVVSGPAGMTVDPVTGALDWTPTEAQGPRTNTVVVRVIDHGLPPLSGTNQFQVIVNEVNQPPVLTTQPRDFTVKGGRTLVFTNTATDPDWPANTLVFARDLDFPDGAALDRQTGVFTWIAPRQTSASTLRFTLWVTDDGTPYQSDSNTFTVTALAAPAAPRLSAVKVDVAGLVVISWEADPGARYQVQYTSNLAEPAWVNAGGVVSAATVVEAIPPGTESQRFYRVVLLEP